MNNFFEYIMAFPNRLEWGELLDWLFDDTKFDNWEKSDVSRLTTQITKNEIEKNAVFIKNASDEVFSRDLPNKTTIIIREDGGSKDIIRHIRNGIAHQHIDFYRIGNSNYVLLRDYYAKGSKYHKKGDDSAYLFVPVTLLFVMKRLYENLLVMNNTL